MGAGKSTVGRLLARNLGYRFVDTDTQLVRQFHLPVADIFAQYGEASFREAEQALLSTMLGETHVVVSTGGGTLTREETLAPVLAAPATCLVYLRAPVEILYERVIFSRRERPLLDVPNAEQQFRERFSQRQPYYLRAHVVVDTENIRPEDIVRRMYEAVATWQATALADAPPTPWPPPKTESGTL